MVSEPDLARAVVELSATAATEAEPVRVSQLLANKVVDVLDIDGAGVVVTDSFDKPHLVAASTEAARRASLAELRLVEGPCLDTLRRGRPQGSVDLVRDRTPWPRYAAAAAGLGFVAVQTVPIRRQSKTLGALDLFRTRPGRLAVDELAAVEALASVAASRIAHYMDLQERDKAVGHLQTALDSRVLIEQAKGILAAHSGITVDEAFSLLRSHARNTNRRLHDVAAAVIGGGIERVTLAPRPR